MAQVGERVIGIFHRKKVKKEFKKWRKAKKNVFFHGVLPRKNTGLHPPIGGKWMRCQGKVPEVQKLSK